MKHTIAYITLLLTLSLNVLAEDPPKKAKVSHVDSTLVNCQQDIVNTVEAPPVNLLESYVDLSASLLDSLEFFRKEERDPICVSPEMAANNDSLIEARLTKLGESRLIPLDYNEAVKEYIHAYAIRNSEKVSRILGESQYYFPIFEEYLDRYNLPPELKYLAAVESALDPNAVSKSGAVGLWQFLSGTAGLFDLEMTGWIDERRDVHASTDAACRYLEYLYRIYGDWHLVLASYNGGPGAVQKAIARNGGNTNYWELRPKLSKQMQNYVPAFIAMNYVMVYHEDFGITPRVPLYSYYDTDTVRVFSEVSFKELAKPLSISDEGIQYLNPIFRKSTIPESKEGYAVVLPRHDVIELILNSENISTAETQDEIQKEEEKLNLKQITVQPGDSFHKLAIRYNCMIEDIFEWNKIDIKHKLKAGEKLLIHFPENK